MPLFYDRITVNPAQFGGCPCVRGTRVLVDEVLALLATGLSSDQVIQVLPDLNADDVAACLRYVGRRWHPFANAA